MLTLTQAQERLAAYRDLAIDWTRPAEEACRIALAANDLRLRRAEVEAIHETLSAYAAHLHFEAGKAFRLVINSGPCASSRQRSRFLAQQGTREARREGGVS